MSQPAKAIRIDLFNFSTPQMRAFHLAWMAFFVCFFAWFGIAPLMSIVREELQLTKSQVGWCLIGSVAITIISRLFIGWLCDRIGPRLCYTGLLIVGSLPVFGIALANDFESFLFFRVLIGVIGASFVITQYHTSAMFADNCVGTANATTAGWGNLGGGVTQFAMPMILATFVGVLGLSNAAGWRLSMVVAGALCMAMGVAYFYLTQDTPAGNLRDLRANGQLPESKKSAGSFAAACRDPRVWILAALYGACFGLELTVKNVAALYFVDSFETLRRLDPLDAARYAGLIVGLYGSMNFFARTLGGWIGDRSGNRWGWDGRVRWLFVAIFCEGVILILFSQTRSLAAAIPALVVFALFVQMSCGATFSIVPFVLPRAVGSVSGIVGAGGNLAAVGAGFLFKSENLDWSTAFLLLGAAVTLCSFLSFRLNLGWNSALAESSPLAREPRLRLGEPSIPALQDT
ncbi:MAG: MFS transporter [Pirellulales bacterium]|nr:MFS transporter [Pirellulales bacterium]